MGEPCGAVTGALMIIGLKYGNVEAKDKKARDKTYELAREFVSTFEDRNGTINCKTLLDCPISASAGLSIGREKKLFQTVCPKYVRGAAEIVEQILNQRKSSDKTEDSSIWLMEITNYLRSDCL